MKIQLLAWSFAILALYTPHSFAEWEILTRDEAGTTTFYLDYSRIRENNGFVYYWSLIDMIEPRNGFLSYEEYTKGICSTNMITNRSLRFFKGPMGTGEEEAFNYDDDKWTTMEEGMIGYTQLKEVCQRLDSQ